MSKREQVLNALFERLSSIEYALVKRNETLPQKITKYGIVILRDGIIGTPDILLSPPRFLFTHKSEIEVMVQHPDAFERDFRLDFLLEKIGKLITIDPTLSGLVDYMYADPPEFIEQPIDGGVTIKAALVSINLEYESNSNLT